MPLYEYACEVCGHTFEVLQKFSDPPPGECGSCGGNVERLISAPAIQFKGAGWYVTDYAKKGADPSEAEKAEKADKTEKKENKEKKEKKAAKTDSGSKTSEKSSSSKDN